MAIDERDGRGFPKRWTGLTATGTNQATAFVLLDGGYHEFTTVGSGSGASLPVVMPWSREITISNNGANALLIYPPSGGTIDTTNASVSLPAGSSATYWATSPTNWQDRVTGGSGGGGGGGSTTIAEVSQTASFTATAGSFYAVSGSSNVTATLPTAVGVAGQMIRLRCANGYTGLLTIATVNSQTLGPGSATSQILYAGESALIQSDGSNWVRIGGTIIPCYCAMSISSTQSVPGDGAQHVALLNTVQAGSTVGMGVVASNAIKLIRSGNYMVTLQVSMTPVATNTTFIWSQAVSSGVNGPNGSGYRMPFTGTVATSFGIAGAAVQPLYGGAAGDLITIKLFQLNGSSSAQTFDSNNVLTVQEIPSW